MKKEALTEEKVNKIPHDVLSSMYVQLDTAFNKLFEQNSQLIARVAGLEEQIAVMNQQLYGRKTEKLTEIFKVDEVPSVDEALNEAEVVVANEAAEEPERVTVVTKRKKSKGKRSSDLRYAQEQHDPPHELSAARLNELFPRGYSRLADDTYTKLEFIPETFIKHIGHVAVYVGNHGEGIVRADRPNSLLNNSVLTPSLAAAVINSKYVNAIPLNRLSEEYRRLGVNISRQVMAGWMITLSDRYLFRIYNAMKQRMFDTKLIHCDETPFKVVKDGRVAGTNSYMWVYHTYDRYGVPPIYIYEYQPTRKSTVPKEFLKDFKGILLTDGYQVYHKIANERPEELEVAGCWVHCKRHFAEIVKSAGKSASKGSVSEEAVMRISEIYRLDNEYKEASDEERLANRQGDVKDKVDSFFSWIKSINTEAMDKSGKLYKAIQYAINQEKYLRVFLDNPIVPLDNNDAERSIRKFCVGKHSWHVIATPDGAKASAMLYSITETARANGLKPYEYVKYVLEQLLEHFSDESDDFINEIMPWSETLPENIKEYEF